MKRLMVGMVGGVLLVGACAAPTQPVLDAVPRLRGQVSAERQEQASRVAGAVLLGVLGAALIVAGAHGPPPPPPPPIWVVR